MKFLSPEVSLRLYKSPYIHVWNTVVMSGLVSLIATWKCQTSYKNKYAGLLVLHLLPLLNPWLIIEMWSAQVFSIGITLVDVLQNWLNWFHFLFLVGGLLLVLTDCMIFLSPFLNVQGCLCQQFLSSHCQKLEFSAYRVHFFEL